MYKVRKNMPYLPFFLQLWNSCDDKANHYLIIVLFLLRVMANREITWKKGTGTHKHMFAAAVLLYIYMLDETWVFRVGVSVGCVVIVILFSFFVVVVVLRYAFFCARRQREQEERQIL